mmetsp:Transcript_120582/g.191197  ORF Transcript_120582/g.191197 Transcript_120582/m.191197 type:complete len:202 (+) Transcript_120582:62-667(+)
MVVDIGEYGLAVGATVAYFIMWNGFLMQQLVMKGSASGRVNSQKRRWGGRFDYSFAEWEMADRTIANTQEQMIGFLLPMWLYAIFCDAHGAGILGFVYVVFRLLYPIFWSSKGGFTLLVEMSTQPSYMIQAWYLLNLLITAIRGERFEISQAWLFPILFIAFWLAYMVVGWVVVGCGLGTLNKKLMQGHFDSDDSGEVESA